MLQPLHKGNRVHIAGRLQTRRWADPESGDVRLRVEIIASEVIFLGGMQQSNLPPAYGFELEGLPDIGGAEDETTAPITIWTSANRRSTGTHRPGW